MINETGILNINTKNLIYNYNFFKKLKKNLIVAPTIKANAYGLGDKKVFNLLLKNSCKHFFVATLDEGLKLKNKDKLINIFILNGLQDYNLKRFFNSNLIPVINSIEEYIRIKNSGLKFAIHVDTGINRLGIPIEKTKEIDFKNKNIIVTGGNSGLGNATCNLIEELGGNCISADIGKKSETTKNSVICDVTFSSKTVSPPLPEPVPQLIGLSSEGLEPCENPVENVPNKAYIEQQKHYNHTLNDPNICICYIDNNQPRSNY